MRVWKLSARPLGEGKRGFRAFARRGRPRRQATGKGARARSDARRAQRAKRRPRVQVFNADGAPPPVFRDEQG